MSAVRLSRLLTATLILALALSASGPVVAQDDQSSGPAALLVEGDAPAVAGSVSWNLVPAEPNAMIVAEAAFPDRGLKVDLVIARGATASSPNSHRIDVLIDSGETGPTVAAVTAIAMSDSEDGLAEPLVAREAMPGIGLFRFDLPREAILPNGEALEKLGWFAVALLYQNGTRTAVLLNKGSTGARVFAAAFADWIDPPPDVAAGPDGTDSQGAPRQVRTIRIGPSGQPSEPGAAFPADAFVEGDAPRQVQVIRIGPDGQVLP